jgi:hypothetical protein
MGSNLTQQDGRPSLEAADLHNRAPSRHARGEQPQKASFVLPKMTWDLPGFSPRVVKDSLEICRNVNTSQRSSPEFLKLRMPEIRSPRERIFVFSVVNPALENLTHSTSAQ